MHKIFISYSRKDYPQVVNLKNRIEKLIGGGTCWIDLAGIESDRQFVDVIIDAIDKSKIFLFMYSKHSDKSEWTRKEIEYAKSEKKKIVFIKIDGTSLSKYYRFQFGGHEIIDINNDEQFNKLLRNLLEWTDGNHSVSNMRKEASQAISTEHNPTLDWNFNFFSTLFHPIVNMGIAFQLFVYSLFLFMCIWTFLGGCLAFYQHPQLSHVMLILSLSASIYATASIKKLQSFWIGLIFVLDFIEIYLVSHLGEFLYHNWHLFSKLSYPQSIRYQLLYSLGEDMQHNSFAGISTYLIFLAVIHIIITCFFLCIRKDKVSAWSRMT